MNPQELASELAHVATRPGNGLEPIEVIEVVEKVLVTMIATCSRRGLDPESVFDAICKAMQIDFYSLMSKRNGKGKEAKGHD